MKRAIITSKIDNVATLLEDANKNDLISITGDINLEIVAEEKIPKGHKISLTDFSNQEKVIKYGKIIGLTLKEIRKGEHVHTHNIKGRETE